ncbi:MAG TPA: mechanosensitive ion channel domain-containing protein [Desulfobacteria bacterium]|nr:mechanosensitive ion channel domain-containing protein [Desulfobacteria bacterium]
MIKKIVNTLALIIITGLFWFAQFQYPNTYLERGFYTLLAVTILYLAFKSVIEEIVVRNIKEPKARYSFRKTVSILYIVGIVLALIRIWVEHTQTLLVSYGLIAAGIAIALQDFFKNFVGGVIIFVTGIYRVGDRIEINAKIGDVIDIGISYTTLLELKEWVAGDQATGRLTILPNGVILSGMINNYTKDNNFIWDEIELPITYGSDWKEAATTIRHIVGTETKTMAEAAEQEILKLGEKYYLTTRAVEPEIYLTLTDNWITFHIRYITDVRQRRVIRNKLGLMILEEIQKSEKVKIASATVDIVGLPELRITQTG